MSEPRTDAGRDLLMCLGSFNRMVYAPNVLAIEAEARRAALTALRTEVEGLPQQTVYADAYFSMTYDYQTVSRDVVLVAIDRMIDEP